MSRSSILLVPLVLVLGGCSLFQGQQDIAPCIKESQHELLIEWGTYDNYQARTGAGYELSVRAELTSITVGTDTVRDHITWIEHRQY